MVRRTTRGSWAAAFRDKAAVQWAVLTRERRGCDGQRGGVQRCVCILFAHGHGQDPMEDPIIINLYYKRLKGVVVVVVVSVYHK